MRANCRRVRKMKVLLQRLFPQRRPPFVSHARSETQWRPPPFASCSSTVKKSCSFHVSRFCEHKARAMTLMSWTAVAEAWRLNKHKPEPNNLSVTFLPTSSNLQRYLIASLFKSDHSGSLPGIPFHSTRFLDAEKKSRVDFDSIVLSFRSTKGKQLKAMS
jgi:hypothetical protein